MIHHISLDVETVVTATRRAYELGQLHNSITKGGGNLAGFVGEEMVKSFFPNISHENTYDYDLRLAGATMDVKTKRTTVAPKPHYECSVAAYNTKQDTDVYVFCRVRNNYAEGWVLGFYPKDLYYDDATFMEKGQIDPDNNFTVKADCYNLPISSLWDITDLPEYVAVGKST